MSTADSKYSRDADCQGSRNIAVQRATAMEVRWCGMVRAKLTRHVLSLRHCLTVGRSYRPALPVFSSQLFRSVINSIIVSSHRQTDMQPLLCLPSILLLLVTFVCLPEK